MYPLSQCTLVIAPCAMRILSLRIRRVVEAFHCKLVRVLTMLLLLFTYCLIA